MIHLSGDLPASKTWKRRAWYFLHVAGADWPALTIVQSRSRRPGAACEADTYDIDEDFGQPFPWRRFLLHSRTDDAIYETTVGPTDRCTCDGHAAGGHRCKHQLAIRALHELGVLDDPPQSGDAEAMDRAFGPAVTSQVDELPECFRGCVARQTEEVPF